MNLKKIALASAIVGLASLGATQTASAIPLIQFAQTAGVNTVTGTNNGAGVTTISGTGITVSIAQIDAATVTPFNAFLTLSATSTGVATGGVASTQNYNGSFSITQNANGTGANYLSGTFGNAVLFGLTGGAQFGLGAAQPPQSLTFTSSVIAAADLDVARGLTFSFTNATPGLGITNNSISSFTATVSGNASGNVQTSQVPEPASLLLLGTGLAAAARARRRKAATKA